MTAIGILGAGKVGTILARYAVAAGYRTLISGSGNPAEIALIIEVMSPGAVATTADDVIREAEVVILAIPLGKYRALPAEQLRGKVVIDAMNYWPEADGSIAEFEGATPSSLIIAAALSGARLVRAFNHLGYHQLEVDARPQGAADRHALAMAGDDTEALSRVADLVDSMGFDPVIAGDLAASKLFGPGSPLFGTSTTRAEVIRLLATPATEPLTHTGVLAS